MGRECERALKLSERLLAAASLVTSGLVLADIGTDHAWIPVALLLSGRISFAYACDIGTGPLQRASEHIAQYGLSDRAEPRLSDGLHALEPGECDVVLIAGMGGELMTRILKEGFARKNDAGKDFPGTVRRWILSPHTEWEVLRRFLRGAGLAVAEETMVQEDGKFYPVICAEPGDPEAAYQAAAAAGIPGWTAERFGPLLTVRRHPAAVRCMERELKKDRRLLSQLTDRDSTESLSPAGKERIAELEMEVRALEATLARDIPDTGQNA